MIRQDRPANEWTPLYFLASVGAGGLTVTFFMYLLFWVPHPGRPVPVVEDVLLAHGSATPAFASVIILAAAGIALFGAMNLYLLGWNIRRVGAFARSDRGRSAAIANAQTQMMAMPLAFAMSVNVAFIVELVFVPNLWSVVEYLFPAALVAFALIGALALKQLGAFLGRVVVSGGFDCQANNSFAQLLPAFTFAMIGVGLAAPASMSVTPLTVGVSLTLSTFFLVAAVTIAIVGVVLGMRSMLENGVAVEQAPTLLIVMPLLTILGILLLRQDHGLHAHFGAPQSGGETFALLTRVLSLEVLVALFGLVILSGTGYLRRYVLGAETSVGTYALICPGVALSVMLHFWINKGLVPLGLVEAFGAAYWALTAVALALQFAMVALLLVLNRRHFGSRPTPALSPAE
jgi:hypothetical protein